MLSLLVLISLAVIIFLLLYIYNYYTDPRRVIDKTFVGPFRYPFVGNALIAACSREEFYKRYLNLCKTYDYKPFRLWFLNKPYVLVSDYEDCKTILSNNFLLHKSEDYRYFEPWLGEGLLIGGGEKWRQDRKTLTPAFHFKILHRFFKIFNDNAEILCDKLSTHDGGEVFDAFEYIEMLTMDNICDAAMGVNIQAQLNPTSNLVNAIKNMAMVFYSRTFKIWLRSDAIFEISPTARMQKKSLDIIHGNDYELIRKKKEEWKTKKDEKLETSDFDEKKKVAFLDLLVEMQDSAGLSDDDIREQVDTFMFAGHDTTTATLGFVFYSLAAHADIQEKVYQELLSIFGDSDRCPDYNDLQAMKYTEQVIKETLRMYTVVPITGRRIDEDFKLNDHQYVPKGVDLIVIFSGLHQNPELFPNPEVFDPDRFAPEAALERDAFAFVPFSAGLRNCIGQKFAMHQMKTTIYKVVKRFKLSVSGNPKDKVRPRAGVIITSENGIRIKVQSRKTINL